MTVPLTWNEAVAWLYRLGGATYGEGLVDGIHRGHSRAVAASAGAVASDTPIPAATPTTTTAAASANPLCRPGPAPRFSHSMRTLLRSRPTAGAANRQSHQSRRTAPRWSCTTGPRST